MAALLILIYMCFEYVEEKKATDYSHFESLPSTIQKWSYNELLGLSLNI